MGSVMLHSDPGGTFFFFFGGNLCNPRPFVHGDVPKILSSPKTVLRLWNVPMLLEPVNYLLYIWAPIFGSHVFKTSLLQEKYFH